MTQKAAFNFCENDLQVPAQLLEIDTVEENKAIQAEIKRRGDIDVNQNRKGVESGPIHVWLVIIVMFTTGYNKCY